MSDNLPNPVEVHNGTAVLTFGAKGTSTLTIKPGFLPLFSTNKPVGPEGLDNHGIKLAAQASK